MLVEIIKVQNNRILFEFLYNKISKEEDRNFKKGINTGQAFRPFGI